MVVSDLEATMAMLNRAGIAFEQTDRDHPMERETPGSRAGEMTEVRVEDLGYSGFFTVFGFDQEGRLLSVGSWE